MTEVIIDDVGRPYYENKHFKVYCGNAPKIMSAMPTGMAHMCMTSPPYFGLRDYHTELQIWGGSHDCQHDFFDRKYKMHNGRGDSQKSARYSEQPPIPDFEVVDGVCAKCGAWKGELGLEPTRELFIDHLMLIFDQVWRILPIDGTCFVNIGDSYASKIKGSGGDGQMGNRVYARLKERAGFEPRRFELGKLVPGTLLRIPHKFCDAMEDRGWILRNDIVWYKPNVMPESVRTRYARSHEFVFFFVKTMKPQYWTNTRVPARSNRQPAGVKGIEGVDWYWTWVKDSKTGKMKRVKRSYWHTHRYFFEQQFEPYETPEKELVKYMEFDYEGKATKDYESAGAQDPSASKQRMIESIRANLRGRFGGNKAEGYGNPMYSGKPWEPNEFGRFMRDVWIIPSESYEGAHFAPYPQELCRRCISAGCPFAICNKCGHNSITLHETEWIDTRPGFDTGNGKLGRPEDPNASLHNSVLSTKRQKPRRTIEGHTDCGCDQGWHAGTVLDPFGGSLTTNLVAMKLGRRSIAIELNPKFIDDAIRIRFAEIDLNQDMLF